MIPCKRLAAVACAALMSIPFAACAEDAASPISWEVGAVSDYLFRGASQTDEKPTVQGSVTWTTSSGLYVGSFASGVDFGEDSPDIEVDYFVGYGFDASDSVNLDVMLNRYTYPGASELAYNELITTATIAEHSAITVGYTNDIWGSGTDGWYYGLRHDWVLPREATLSASVGRTQFRDNLAVAAEDYTDWSVAVSHRFGPAEVSLGYFGTDASARASFGKLADNRLLLSIKLAR